MENMLTLTIDVTEQDMTRGERMSCLKCPIALAVRRAAGPDVTKVEVDEAKVFLSYVGGRRFVAHLPMHMRMYIYYFDTQALSASPFTQTLNFTDITEECS